MIQNPGAKDVALEQANTVLVPKFRDEVALKNRELARLLTMPDFDIRSERKAEVTECLPPKNILLSFKVTIINKTNSIIKLELTSNI